jgi:hypothetical protein
MFAESMLGVSLTVNKTLADDAKGSPVVVDRQEVEDVELEEVV